jgi:hypothetical protein
VRFQTLPLSCHATALPCSVITDAVPHTCSYPVQCWHAYCCCCSLSLVLHINCSSFRLPHLPADHAMYDCFDAAYVTLHVRVSNKTAFHLYKNTLGYECAPRSFALMLAPSMGTAAVRITSGVTDLSSHRAGGFQSGHVGTPPTAPARVRHEVLMLSALQHNGSAASTCLTRSSAEFHFLGACSVHDVEKKYYADGEDAYCMRKTFKAGVLDNGKAKDRH